jgi:hypothetical protein
METPTVRLLSEAATPITVKDSDGRALFLRRMGALDRLRLFKAVGAELAQNAPYLGMAMLASSVTAIDGIPVPAPTTEAQIEALIQRLGDAGLAAAASVLADQAASPGSADQGN